MQVKSKIYYEIATGNVLLVTSEMEGSVIETTKEQDIQYYSQLQGKDANEIDFIELEYGTLVTTFTNAKSYIVNLTSKKLEVTYYTQQELDELVNTTTT